MSEINYMKNLLLFIIIIAPFFFLMVLFPLNERGFTRLLPDLLFFQIGYVFWMSAIAAVIGAVFAGFLLAPLFLIAHRYTVGIRMTYGLQERPVPKKLKAGFKGLFPSLLAINLALMYAQLPWVQEFVLSDLWLNRENAAAMQLMLTFASILPLFMGISHGVFSSVWFLLDAGIVFTNKNKVKDLRDPIEVRSVGGWYHYILKGYAGIGIIVSYFFFSNAVISETGGIDEGIFIIPLIPLLMVIMSIPAFIILEKTANVRKKYILKYAKKLGITQPLEDPLNIKI
ncbi:MAG: hypothetical protein ACTSR8_13875 [Promethearchaeota archaeon]